MGRVLLVMKIWIETLLQDFQGTSIATILYKFIEQRTEIVRLILSRRFGSGDADREELSSAKSTSSTDATYHGDLGLLFTSSGPSGHDLRSPKIIVHR